MASLLRWMVRLCLSAALAVALGYIPYRAYGPNGVGKSLRLKRELAEIVQGNAALQRDNQRLRDTIDRLKNEPAAIERFARDELGLVRPEDVVLLFE